MQIPQPEPEHRWLQRLVGEWLFEHECSTGPDAPPSKSTGTQSTRSLGGLWIMGDIHGTIPGGAAVHSVITIGYDPTTKKFVGTFISSCMTHLWPYQGTLDAAKRILTLDSEGPSFAEDGSLAKYQDIIEVVDDDHHTMTSRSQGPDGKWTQFMVGKYRRK